MSYSNNLKKSMEEYQNLLTEYKEMTESEQYAEIVRTMPFEFVNGLNICNLLTSFNNDSNTAKMNFQSAQDAEAIYNRIIDFRNKYQELLENADFVIEAKSKADAVNDLVANNLYLPTSLKIRSDTFIESLAKECIEQIPHYPELLTKKFRNRFTESCIECLSNEELDKLVMNHIIKSNNLDMIAPVGSKQYEEHLSHLCHILHHDEIVMASYKQSLKGTSFENEDGTKRQEILTRLDAIVKEGKTPILEAEQYIFHPEVGKDEPAIRILWNNDVIGYIAKDVVLDILGKYKNPGFKVELKEITGGNGIDHRDKQNILYGCNVDLKVFSLVPQKESPTVDTKDIEK